MNPPRGRPATRKGDVQFPFNVPPALRDNMKRVAAAQDVSVASILRKLGGEYVEAHDRPGDAEVTITLAPDLYRDLITVADALNVTPGDYLRGLFVEHLAATAEPEPLAA